MSSPLLTAPAVPMSGEATAGGGLRWLLADALVIARRHAIGIRRAPQVLFYSAIQPIMFVLMFTYVFGGSIQVPGESYAEYLVPGVLVQTVAFTVAITASHVAIDMQRGVVDRFRSLPIARSTVLIGRTASDLLIHSISIVAVVACGLVVGWRTHAGVWEVLAGFGLLLLFGYTMSWVGVFIGLSVRAPEVASQASMLWVIPVVFLSNLFVVVDRLPGWLQPVAKWNPVSAVITTVRDRFGNPYVPIPDSLPGKYPGLMAVLCIGLVLALFIPLSVRQYRRTVR